MCSPASTSRCARVTSAQRVFPAFADALGMTEAEFEAKLRSDYQPVLCTEAGGASRNLRISCYEGAVWQGPWMS
jgi:hypothetical protein